MTRRTFVCGAAALIACLGSFGHPSTADAQQPASPRRIGVLLVGQTIEEMETQAFRQGLLDAGYVEGRDVVFEWRSANGDYDRVPQLVADLVQRKVDVIVADSTSAARAAKRATSTIPIVMALVADPVGSGLVANLAHPGGNVTGLSIMLAELSDKRLQLLKETLPQVVRVAVLWNPATPWHPKAIEALKALKAVAPSLSIDLSFVSVRTAEEIGPAFSAMTRAHAGALYVLGDAFFHRHQGTLLTLAAKSRLAVTYDSRQFTDAGALMSYGPNYSDVFRRAASYVDRILKGANPGDLPIEQPTKFELVVNLKTAKTLGITIPRSILLRADEVIR